MREKINSSSATSLSFAKISWTFSNIPFERQTVDKLKLYWRVVARLSERLAQDWKQTSELLSYSRQFRVCVGSN